MIRDDYMVECKIETEDEDPKAAKSELPDSTPVEIPHNTDPRDPRGINQHLKLDFADVLAEPSSFHSLDKVWTWSDILFEATKLWCYRITSVFCAIPVSIVTGILFALVTCLHIWCLVPFVRICMVIVPPIQYCWENFLDNIIAPCSDSMGRCGHRVYMTIFKK
ncbi:caveolin-2-like [Protopterus annectens]|uniref:caveolin-2-like n=1 Tax=Protopterus annectens TaxID=7888 RepID=UPI001CF97FB7|nr:caveolin-2-like [Protopterus annectens]